MSRGLIATAILLSLGLGIAAWAITSENEEELLAEHEPLLEEDDGPERRGRRGRDPEFKGKRSSKRGLQERVAVLESEMAALKLELRKSRMIRPAVAVRDDSSEADGDSPQFEGAVRDIIEADRAEAVERRTDAMRERFAERRTETLEELTAVAGITAPQKESIGALWESESDQVIPLFIAAREGDKPFAEVRTEVEKLREETDQAVEEMLSPAQFEQYEELRPGPGRGGGRGRGGNRGGERPRPQ